MKEMEHQGLGHLDRWIGLHPSCPQDRTGFQSPPSTPLEQPAAERDAPATHGAATMTRI